MILQVKIKDLENDGKITGGIMTEDGDIICGCCGGIFHAEDEGTVYEILEVYHDRWRDVSDAILKG